MELMSLATNNLRSFLLVRHPEAMQKLRAEIAKYDKEDFDRNDLRNMSYLQNVLKESKSILAHS
jgi:hypothetical protein